MDTGRGVSWIHRMRVVWNVLLLYLCPISGDTSLYVTVVSVVSYF